MSDKKDELPGFFRDPKTGKYYRERPESSGITSLKKLKKEREEEILQVENNKCPKVSNVVNYLKARELGLISGLRAEREYFKMRTYNKWLRDEVSLNDSQPHNIVSVNFIKGSVKSVFGVWNINENSKYQCLIGEKPFLGIPSYPKLGFKACANYIIDLCDGPAYSVVYIFSDPLSGVGCFVFLPKTLNSIDTTSCYWGTLNLPVFCCAAPIRSPTFVLGSDGCIKFYNRLTYQKYVPVKGKIYTISFDESSNIMVSGTHLGQLCVHDVRHKELQASIEVSSNCINDSYFLYPDQIIVGGPDNVLKKVDLRMKKVVTEYFGHKASIKKRPFSVANNMLCAAGWDNITRIWHLSGGHPVHEMKPVNDRENAVGGWLHSDCSKTFLYQFEGHFKRIYEIT